MSKSKNFFSWMLNDKRLYKSLLTVALPIIIQNFIASSLNMIDTLMIGKVGEKEIAAIGIANQYFFLFNLFLIGIYAGCGVFISQFWGKEDKENIKKVVGFGNLLGIVVSFIFTLAALVFTYAIISLFNKEAFVIDQGMKYLKLVCLSYLFTAITFNYGTALRAVNKAVPPMIVSMLAILCNTFFNYMFIFGKFGAPKMGVEGAALATLIARIFECATLVAYVYVKNDVVNAKIKYIFSFTKDFALKILKTVTMVVLNEACWGVGTIIYSVVYGRIGTEALAATQICTTVQNMFMVIIFGIASASTVLVGNKVGAGLEEEAIEDSKKIAVISCIIGIFIAILLSGSAGFILSLFNVSETVRNTSKTILYIISVIMIIRVFNITCVVGVLRGGGDTNYSLKLEVFTMWGLGVPSAFIGAFFLKLPVEYVVALVTLEEVVKAIFCLKRLKSDNWIKNIVEEI
ncbi:MATE family efflux transporter [Hathewaya histolytica]|uniref:Multidrug resistance protein n=1 Tax=Hathewaya histolytica TaxID=1498 RepID=A0A4U9R596_HATHI|nr:MATE family efflux transporter [Hathewaya histolytica]VTQ85671.1 multidrug resistance protein [Hathewaya histolytica]